MTTKPFLSLLAVCVAGMVSSGTALVLLVLGVEPGGWWLRVAGLGLFVFLAVMTMGVRDEHRYLATVKAADLDQQQAKTALAWAQVDLTRQALEGDAPADPEPDTADLPRLERQREQEVAHWHVFHRRLVQAGCALGWGRDNLTAGPVKVLTQPAWNVGTNNLQAAGYLFKDGAGTRLIVDVRDWEAARLWEKVPCPAGEPPDILPPPYNNTTTRPNNGKTAAGAVVEGVAREVGK